MPKSEYVKSRLAAIRAEQRERARLAALPVKRRAAREYGRARRQSADGAATIRNAGLRRHYGLTLAEACALWDRQLGACACCGAGIENPGNVIYSRDPGPRPGTARVDRGQLICGKCRSGLGCFGFDLTRIRAAETYLLTRDGKYELDMRDGWTNSED